MLRLMLALLLVACLMLSACQTVMPTPALEVQSQSAEDGTVVFSAAIDGPGWLVLHPAKPGGGPDATTELARAYLPDAGTYGSIKMTLGGAAIGDTAVVAMLHYDDPVDSKFTFAAGKTDDPAVEVEGAAVMVSFTIQGIFPVVEVVETDVELGTVVLKAVIDRAGWLVLHPATAQGTPDTATAAASILLAAAGVYPGFEVSLPTGAAARSYFAVLYYDNPADEEFTFAPGGTDDPPVKVGGVAVEDVFTVGK